MASSGVESESRRKILKSCAGSAILLSSAIPAKVIAGLTTGQQKSVSHEREATDTAIRDAISKARNFEQDYPNDNYINAKALTIMRTVLLRLSRLQRVVGHANFGLISFDDALKYARSYSAIGEFTRAELDFIEQLFSSDARLYGFFGEKVSRRLTDKVLQRDTIKVRGTGHYLYKGKSLAIYHKLQRAIGPELILTSGIRGNVKQLYLFLAKADKTNGNLSRAARSLAPPGHSFHGIGDFDVGQKGLGRYNFTSVFANSKIYRKMSDLGYINERYPEKNPYGVRYEPWHIKVVKYA